MHVPAPALFALAIAGMALGTARGALDGVRAIAGAKVPLFGRTTPAADRLFQFRLAHADADLRAARALVHDCAAAVWAAGTDLGIEQRAQAGGAAVWAVPRASTVVDAAYQAGGRGALHLDCPLQRRLRDIRALAQHFVVRPDTLATAGGFSPVASWTCPCSSRP